MNSVFDNILGFPVFGRAPILGYKDAGLTHHMMANRNHPLCWGILLRNSEEARRFNERGNLSIAKDYEKKNNIFVWEDVQ